MTIQYNKCGMLHVQTQKCSRERVFTQFRVDPASEDQGGGGATNVTIAKSYYLENQAGIWTSGSRSGSTHVSSALTNRNLAKARTVDPKFKPLTTGAVL